MEHFTLFNFLTVSIPEEFLMALLVWIILGKRETVKFINVIVAGLITAVAFAIIQILLFPNVAILVVPQLLAFTVIIYFVFVLDLVEAILGALVASVITLVIQAITTNIGFILTSYNADDLAKNDVLKTLFFIPEFFIFTLICLFLYLRNIKFFNFKKRGTKGYTSDKTRFLVLQLTFTFFIITFNFSMYLFKNNLFASSSDRMLIIMNLCIVFLLTILVLKSAFKMGEKIQKEEALKRKLDGREIVQNIDYLCKLMDLKKYDEVDNILKSMKDEVDNDIINNKH